MVYSLRIVALLAASALAFGAISSAQAQNLVNIEDEILQPLPESSRNNAPPSDDGLSSMTSQSVSAQTQASNQKFDEGVFFDAQDLAKGSEMQKDTAPRSVDPRSDIGSRVVLSRQTHGAGSLKAQLVAADRAMKLGRHESALAIYDGLHARHKRNHNVLLGRAVALQHLGRDNEAVLAYEDFLAHEPKNIDARINMLGIVSKSYPAVALHKLASLYEENPRHVGVIAQIAVVQAKMARFGEAIQYLGIAAGLEPNNAGHIFNMAVIADRAGQKDQAIKYYESALEMDTLHGSGRSIPRESVFERLAELR